MPLVSVPKEKRRGRLLQTPTDTKDTTPNSKRDTRFPGRGSPQSKTLPAASLDGSQEAPEKKQSAPIPSRILISASGLETTGSSLPPVRAVKHVQPESVLAIQNKNPWLTYKPLRNIAQGSQTKVACTRSIPVRIVTLKGVTVATQLDSIVKFQHENLVEFIGAYEYENNTTLVSEFMQVSLRQAIATPYDFEEIHVSAVCSQVGEPMRRQNTVLNSSGTRRHAVFINPGALSYEVGQYKSLSLL